MPSPSPALLERLVEAIRAESPQVIAVYLFGSAARGEARAQSDIDLALLPPMRMGDEDRWELQERLAALAGCDVDLVDLRAASAVMRVQVLTDDLVLFESEPGTRALFEATALADYARLNEERRGILDDVRLAGNVHG